MLQSDQVFAFRASKVDYIAVVVMAVLSVVFFLITNAPVISGDQLTITAIHQYLNQAPFLASDPIYGKKDLYLQINLGVIIFPFLQWLGGTVELGIHYFVAMLHFLQLGVAYPVFTSLTKSRRYGLALSLLSTIPVHAPGATFWGVALNGTLYARAIYLPFATLLIYSFICRTFSSEPKGLRGTFILLGLTAWIHPISAAYLFLIFLLSLICFRATVKQLFICASYFLVGAAYFIIPFLLHRPPTRPMEMVLHNQEYQLLLERAYPWAFSFQTILTEAAMMICSPAGVILVLCYLAYRQGFPLKRIMAMVICTSVAASLPYVFQRLLYIGFETPFFFIEVWRGFRFIPPLAYFGLALILGQHSMRSRSSQSQPWFFLLLICLCWLLSFGISTTPHKKTTCDHGIFRAAQMLPETAVVVSDLQELRYCSEKALFSSRQDFGMAYYHSRAAFKDLFDRLDAQEHFARAPAQDSLAELASLGATHIILSRHAPPTLPLREVEVAGNYRLYAIELPSGRVK
ncbi:MAG: hypothetical protein J5J00_02735 [Deltaproteobacteria bacterium]|nr:hypothetical protein [Deltaproteobacteria bacterium]